MKKIKRNGLHVNAYASVAAILSELICTFTLNKKQKMALMAFLNGQHIFTLLPTSFVEIWL